MISKLSVLAFLFFSQIALVPLAICQNVIPENVGFRAYSIGLENRAVNFYVSTSGQAADTLTTRPLIVYIQGSGFSPIFWGPIDRLSHALMLKPGDFPEHHYVVIGKPGADFWSAERSRPPQIYHELLTLENRVLDISTALDFLVQQSWVDTSEVVVVGHSEGAQVAPAVAVQNGNVTHVAALAASGLSQAYDFVLEVREQMKAGELSFEEGEEQLSALYDQYNRILNSAEPANRYWRGHSHQRWSSFFEPPLNAFLSLDIPVFVGVGLFDESSPIESADYIRVAFMLAQKDNLTYRAWNTDHRFQETGPEGKRIDRRPDVIKALLSWLGS